MYVGCYVLLCCEVVYIALECAECARTYVCMSSLLLCDIAMNFIRKYAHTLHLAFRHAFRADKVGTQVLYFVSAVTLHSRNVHIVELRPKPTIGYINCTASTD